MADVFSYDEAVADAAHGDLASVISEGLAVLERGIDTNPTRGSAGKGGNPALDAG